jgi:hypothetical protein
MSKVGLIEDIRLNVSHDNCEDFYFNSWVHIYS